MIGEDRLRQYCVAVKPGKSSRGKSQFLRLACFKPCLSLLCTGMWIHVISLQHGAACQIAPAVCRILYVVR
jgi:hypothetical protein